jgi:hypothetical protein
MPGRRVRQPLPTRRCRAGVRITGGYARHHPTLAAERPRLAALHQEERIGDDAFHRAEEELDWAEAEVDGSGL